MNQQIDEKKLTNFFIKKPSQLFNLKDKNASLQAKITKDKKESNWLKLEMKKFYARLKDSMNAASIQSKKMEKEIIQLNKKLDKYQDLQNKISEIQKQLILAKQNTLKVHDKLNHEINNWKTHHNSAFAN